MSSPLSPAQCPLQPHPNPPFPSPPPSHSHMSTPTTHQHPAAPSAAVADLLQCRRIQVSREKRPLSFFLTLSKKFLLTDNMIELSGLGLAVTTVVTIAEILKSHNLVSIKHIKTSLVDPHPDGHTMAPKAKIQVWIEKTDQFDQLVSSFGYQMRPNHSASGVSVNANYSGSLTGSPNINASPNSNASASAVSTASPVAESQSQGGDKDLSGNKGPSLYHHHHQREQEANQCESNEGSTTVGSTAVGAESSVEADKSQSGDGGGSMGQNGHEGGQACSSSGTSTGSKV